MSDDRPVGTIAVVDAGDRRRNESMPLRVRSPKRWEITSPLWKFVETTR